MDWTPEQLCLRVQTTVGHNQRTQRPAKTNGKPEYNLQQKKHYNDPKKLTTKFNEQFTPGPSTDGVLSPILFNLYMAKMPAPLGNIRLTPYAEDSTALNSGPRHP